MLTWYLITTKLFLTKFIINVKFQLTYKYITSKMLLKLYDQRTGNLH